MKFSFNIFKGDKPKKEEPKDAEKLGQSASAPNEPDDKAKILASKILNAHKMPKRNR